MLTAGESAGGSVSTVPVPEPEKMLNVSEIHPAIERLLLKR